MLKSRFRGWRMTQRESIARLRKTLKLTDSRGRIARAIIATVIVIFLIALIAVEIGASLEKTFAVVGLVISLISLALMIEIAKDQNDQIKSLEKLNYELQVRKEQRERVKALFLSSDDRKYTCVMPVEYRRQPLPTIAAGDYYAWHVVQNFVGDVQISMDFTNRMPEKEKIVTSKGNIIFLCSPQASPPLDEFAPWLELHGDKIDNSPDAKRGVGGLEKLKLPVWFGCRNKRIANPATGELEDWQEKVICYLPDGRIPDLHNNSDLHNTVAVLTSQVEEDYIAAHTLQDNQRPKKTLARKCDVAVVIRAARGSFDTSQVEGAADKIVVIAGIHQYGTWIAGDFLHQYCNGNRPQVEELFKSEADFAILIYGQFNEQTLSVEASDIHATDAWQFTGGVWDRVALKARTLTGR
jgi:hypothetical protein